MLSEEQLADVRDHIATSQDPRMVAARRILRELGEKHAAKKRSTGDRSEHQMNPSKRRTNSSGGESHKGLT